MIKIYRDDPYTTFPEGRTLRFRLTYAGELLSASNRNNQVHHKHALRKHFHSQLKWFWENTSALKMRQVSRSNAGEWGLPSTLLTGSETRPYLDWVSEKYPLGDFKFAPIVTEEMTLACSLDILMLCPNGPREIIERGDIDNKLKVLFDALQRPTNMDQIRDAQPGNDEEPFFCLLENDKLINRLAVEADMLLEPVGVERNNTHVRLVIDVKITPTRVGFWNLDFVGD